MIMFVCSDTDRVMAEDGTEYKEDSKVEKLAEKPLKLLNTTLGSSRAKTRSPCPRAGPSRTSGESNKLGNKWRTIYVIGDSRAKRMAAHARSKLPDPRLSDNMMAYYLVEVGEAVGNPNKNDGHTRLAILEAAGMNREDIVLLDIFNNASWEDEGSKKVKMLLDPHMLAPIVPSIADSK